jgi:uncharacterized membrane-anchored protein YitT (DUF2179 family)
MEKAVPDENRFRKEIKNAIYILLGSIFLAGGVTLFLQPNQGATGGTPGAAILLHHLSGFPTGMLMLAINVPLLLAGSRLLGKSFALRTIGAILLSSLLIDLFREILNWQALSHTMLLATLYGGIAVGVGVGLILRGNASAGGSTIIARIVASRSQFKSGQVIMALDLLIIVASGIVFNNTEQALWSLISIYATAKCIDMVLTGAPSEKVVHIASDKAALLSEKISQELGPHGTVLTGSGLVGDQQKQLIFVTVDARRITVLRDLIQQHDQNAFMVVMEASELLGRGHGW